MDKKTFYITTPIYYPSDKLHIGHSYTTVAADAMARFKRLTGYDVFFLTGTDEHGQKIQRKAEEHDKTPKEYVDEIVAWIKELWRTLDVSYDHFIRTTDNYHVKAVQNIFQKLYDQGDIYKGEYEGWYCTPCEAFFTEHQLTDGKCPDCGRPVELIREEAYFFKLSKYQDKMIEYIETHPDFIQPPSRRNEMINNFLKPGLEDLCVSRTSFDWGIPVPFDEKHVVYVWIDALSNYITALGYSLDNDELYKKFWPADVHLVGKEIVRFHTIIWPIMLMALGVPLPKKVFGHGWLILEGGKMSKSKGNVVDPKVLVDLYGVDTVRYFLLREIPFGADGVFSNKALVDRINFDLANDLGNLLSRTTTMIEKYCGGKIPTPGAVEETDNDLKSMAEALPEKVEKLMDGLEFSGALQEIWRFIGRANKYIDETMPWSLAKDPAKRERLSTVLYNLAEALRIISVHISPFMPNTPAKIREQLGIADENLTTWESVKAWGKLPAGLTVSRKEIIFPRIEEPAVPDSESDANAASVAGNTEIQKSAEDKETKRDKNQAEKAAGEAQQEEGANLISIDDFAKVQLRVAEVLEAEKVQGADKLLKLQIKLGEEKRQIVAGIAKYYTPEQLIGKKIVVVANLKPARLRGIESQGMLLAASNTEKLALLTVDKDIESGAKIK
ncbi:MAG: methionyl-tRNA synthetase [Thermoanaerobacteraceae bacterium]|nr:methionyl-tRNA synthetase [Thermoanaerobacteraceae bacterium]